jgi:hypothetical protein
MSIDKETKMKNLLTEVISSEYVDIVSGKGLHFDDSIIYDKNYSHITNDDDYVVVEEKLKSIVKLINENPKLVHKDVEDELWYMV